MIICDRIGGGGWGLFGEEVIQVEPLLRRRGLDGAHLQALQSLSRYLLEGAPTISGDEKIAFVMAPRRCTFDTPRLVKLSSSQTGVNTPRLVKLSSSQTGVNRLRDAFCAGHTAGRQYC